MGHDACPPGDAADRKLLTVPACGRICGAENSGASHFGKALIPSEYKVARSVTGTNEGAPALISGRELHRCLNIAHLGIYKLLSSVTACLRRPHFIISPEEKSF